MKNTIWLGCGVLRAEVSQLHQQGLISGKLHFMDSMLHMNPPKLEQILITFLDKSIKKTKNIVLIYGDCCSSMLNIVRHYKIGRVDVINCAQLLLGKIRYRELMREESFLILPEWALRWQEIMKDELGLNAEIAKDLMGENRRELVYLDTGLVPIPENAMESCSQYTGLPWRTEKVHSEHLLNELLTAEKFSIEKNTNEP